MFNKKTDVSAEIPNTVLGKGTILEAAKLTGKDSLRIEGTFRGIIDIEGNIFLADTGVVVGDISARQVLIAGRVDGNVKCGDTAHFAATAKVNGDVTAVSLIVDEGGELNGKYQIGGQPDKQKGEPPVRTKRNEDGQA